MISSIKRFKIDLLGKMVSAINSHNCIKAKI